MCGIAGYIGKKDLNQGRIQGALKAMHHRGPDHAGFKQWKNFAGRNVFLLHTRLSIIDLNARANQPFHYQGNWLVFNGELYNYLEIKAELQRKGHVFETESDTEVFCHLLSRAESQVLDQAEGMWAFAFYNDRTGNMTLGRDRFGEKPLYFYEDDSGLYFASEIKVIFELRGGKPDINYDHLYRYLINGYKSLYKTPQTFFKGVRELEPASILLVDAKGRTNQQFYWQPSYKPDARMTYQDAVEGVRRRLIQSMELRLRADVPLAFCMSGGVDSGSLISIAKNYFGYDVHGFTIVNTDQRYEEQEMINCLAQELDVRHTAIPVKTESFLSNLRRLVRQHDAPVYTIAYYAHWLLMEAIASNGYRISVSGTGADELFTGYYDHHLAYLYEIQHEPVLYAASREAWQKYIQPIVRNPYLKNPDYFMQSPQSRDHIYLNAEAFATYLKQKWTEPFSEVNYTDSLLRKRMLNEMFSEAVPVILHEDDLNAMSYSIENRSPYLDRPLFEFCYSIPTAYLIRDGRTKAILRDAMYEIAPEPIMSNRRKVGFNAPIFSFLDLSDPKVRESLLDSSPIFEHVEKQRIEKLIQKGNLPNSESKFLFYFLAGKMFLEEFAA